MAHSPGFRPPVERAGRGGTTEQPILRIQTFGGLRARLGDEPLALPPSRQARALLAYLACASRPVHRSSLCEILWEDATDPKGALRWCLSRLRPVLDAGDVVRLLAEGELMRIAEDGCEVDAKILESLAATAGMRETAALETAVARLSGTFLADLELSDAFRFESWKVAEGKSLVQARSLVFEELLRRHSASPEAAVRLGHVWVQQDPLDPRPHVAVIRALTALDRRREALAHYDRCVQMLRRHGSAPPPELEKARLGIGRLGVGNTEDTQGCATPAGSGREPSGPTSAALASATPIPVASVSALPASLSGRPLAGREEEMGRFRACLAAAAGQPDGRLHILSGEPGIGKTRILEEMGRILAEAGWMRLRGRAFEAERGRAFGPWIDAARAIAADYPQAADECPLLRPSMLPENGRDPSALFEAMHAWLASLARTAPLALLLDDLQWLDPSSLALLQYLLRAPDHPIRLMLASLRSVAARPDEAVESFLGLLRREGWSEGWDIGPLGRDATAQLLLQAGSRLDPSTVFAQSAGHPLASLALAFDGAEEGRRARASLEAMLDERVRLAGDTGRDILQWASLLGRGLPPALLEALLDLPVHSLLAALERLEAEGLMQVRDDGTEMDYLFGHDLIRQRVQESLSAPRRARMHAHVAQTLRGNPSLSRGWEEVALHAERGEQWELAAEACLEACRHCIGLRAFEPAEGLVIRGLAHLDRLGGHWALQREFCRQSNQMILSLPRISPALVEGVQRLVAKARAARQEETALAALFSLATIRYGNEQPSDLLEAALQMDENAGEVVDPAVRAASLAGMALCLIVTDQEIPRARKLTREAERLCVEHGLEGKEILASRGWEAHRDGRYADARALLTRSLNSTHFQDVTQMQHQVLALLAQIELEDNAPLEAVAWAEKMRPLHEVVRNSADRYFPDGLTALAHRMLDLPDAEALFLATLEKLREWNCKVMTSYLLLSWSEMDLAAGRFREIAERCQEAIQRCEPLGRVAEPSWARCLLGLAALRQGREAEAREHWKELAPILAGPHSLPARIFHLAGRLSMELDQPV